MTRSESFLGMYARRLGARLCLPGEMSLGLLVAIFLAHGKTSLQKLLTETSRDLKEAVSVEEVHRKFGSRLFASCCLPWIL